MPILQGLFTRSGRSRRRPSPSTPEGRLHAMFDAADSVVVVAGPELSAGSGLPPGLLGQPAPDVAPIRYRHFLVDPDARLEHWRRSLADAQAFAAAAPNSAHAALAALTRDRRLKVVTLAPDGLLARAGVHPDDLVEMHGRGDVAVCLGCGQRTPIAIHAATVAAGKTPTCARDGDLLKPGAALFGESPVRSAKVRSDEWAGACDLLIVAGTTLPTHAVTGLPGMAREAGARIAVVGRARPVRDMAPDLTVDADAAETIATLAR